MKKGEISKKLKAKVAKAVKKSKDEHQRRYNTKTISLRD
tara:strand:+ start:1484 stop:1600 length:117 start_codon:yes stop_codon:yes gene_type:complete